MTNLNEQMEMFDKEMSERKELDKLNKLFSKGVPFLKEQKVEKLDTMPSDKQPPGVDEESIEEN